MMTRANTTEHLILAIDDDHGFLEATTGLLKQAGYRAIAAGGGREGLALLTGSAAQTSLVLLDMRMPDMDGLETLEHIVRFHPSVPVMMLTGENAIELVVNAMKSGAVNYISKTSSADEILAAVRAVIEQTHRSRPDAGGAHRFERHGVIGRSAALINLLADAEMCANSALSVLITGETGVGKDVVARVIHAMSPRGKQPLIPVDVPNIPATMFESELFGYKRGAFTGAVDNKPGLLQAADGGTLFLDEIGEFPLELQPKFLRVLETRTVRRLGSVTTETIDARFISATNRDLLEAVRSRSFREDLLYRLRGIELHVPPLRDRREDVAPIAEHYLASFLKANGLPPKRLNASAIELLERQWWHGNVRELQRVIEAVAVMTKAEVISHIEISRVIERNGTATANQFVVVHKYDDVQMIARLSKKDELMRILDCNNWNITRAAAELDIDRSTLSKQMKLLGIVKPKMKM